MCSMPITGYAIFVTHKDGRGETYATFKREGYAKRIVNQLAAHHASIDATVEIIPLT